MRRRAVGPVETKLDRSDFWCETPDLREPVLDRARTFGAAPLVCVGFAELNHGEVWSEEKDSREAPEVDLVPRLVPTEREEDGHSARAVPQTGVDARIGVDRVHEGF